MKVYYLINNNNEIIQDDYVKFSDNCLEIDLKNYRIANGFNGSLYFEEYMQTDEYKAKEKAYKENQAIKRLRRQRDNDCFSVVNRGAVWYERLSQDQKNELNIWYQEWLDVTETLSIPKKPSWLK